MDSRDGETGVLLTLTAAVFQTKEDGVIITADIRLIMVFIFQ